MPAPLLKALKDNRDAVVAYLTECSTCGRNNGDPEDRDRLREVNPYCREHPCPFRGCNS